jgi:hypothetical protein
MQTDEQKETTIKWLCERFSLSPSEILGYNSGICYSRIWVNSREAAMKVHDKVKGRVVNGGMFDGMPLGSICEGHDGRFDVTC